jgi:hypothetical protein
MASKREILHLPKHGNSALVKSNGISSIVARGRHEAAALAARKSDNMPSSSEPAQPSTKPSPVSSNRLDWLDEYKRVQADIEAWEEQKRAAKAKAEAQFKLGELHEEGEDHPARDTLN